MKIAVIAGIDKEISLTSKGGIEVWTAEFIQEHVKRGIAVDLYAVRGSLHMNGVTLRETLPKPLSAFYSDPYFVEKPKEFTKRKEEFMGTVYTKIVSEVKQQEDSYDCIIDSCSYPAFTFNTGYFSKPVFVIGHFPVDFATTYYIDKFGLSQNNYYVFPSHFQLQQAQVIPQEKKTVIPHGLPIHSFPFFSNGGDYMVWLSRFHKRTDKGLEQAMRLSNTLKIPLRASGYVEKTSETYFQKVILPLQSEYAQVTRQDLTDRVDKRNLIGQAKLFLFPIQWDEPFGLVTIESLALGTPVVTFERGAMSDIIVDGVTGFLVNFSEDDIRGDFIIKKSGLAGIREAIKRIYAMSEDMYQQMRKNCRKRVEDQFTIEKMVDEYEGLYRKVLLK